MHPDELSWLEKRGGLNGALAGEQGWKSCCLWLKDQTPSAFPFVGTRRFSLRSPLGGCGPLPPWNLCSSGRCPRGFYLRCWSRMGRRGRFCCFFRWFSMVFHCFELGLIARFQQKRVKNHIYIKHLEKTSMSNFKCFFLFGWFRFSENRWQRPETATGGAGNGPAEGARVRRAWLRRSELTKLSKCKTKRCTTLPKPFLDVFGFQMFEEFFVSLFFSAWFMKHQPAPPRLVAFCLF